MSRNTETVIPFSEIFGGPKKARQPDPDDDDWGDFEGDGHDNDWEDGA